MVSRFREFIEIISSAQDTETLFQTANAWVKAKGFDVCSYHIVAQNLMAVPIRTGLIRETFPDEWVERYLSRDYYKIDPVFEQAMKEAEPFHWFEVGERIKLRPEQKQFLKELREAGLTDGLAVPVFGPLGTMAYFGLGKMGGKITLSEGEIGEVQLACQRVHNRYVELMSSETGSPEQPALSAREKQVLRLIARGLSNPEIAERLEISENTVDTIIRRAFRKLGANNRITAVLKSIGSGVLVP